MKPLLTISLLDICSPALAADPGFNAAAVAIDEEMQAVSTVLWLVDTLTNLDAQTSLVLDYIAIALQVYNYSTTFPIPQKIALILASLDWHMRVGTPSVLKEVINASLAYCELQEWFQYGGTAYHFRLLFSQSGSDPILDAQVIATVLMLKNVRSYFDGSFFISAATSNVYAGMATASYSFQDLGAFTV